jgi:type III pantothenate kinase
MNLVIDIGNTQTKVAWYEQGRLTESVRLDNDNLPDLYKITDKNPVKNIILSSVGIVEPSLVKALENKKTTFIILDHKTSLPIEIEYHTPETLGRDRIAAAAGARYVCPYCNVLVVDMGTAITYEFITSEGKYLGGNISPGMLTRYRALHEFTAKLPLVSKDQNFPSFGTDTRTAIVAGVQQGIIYEINSYIDEYTQMHPACEFILTGGDADFFVSKLKRSIFAIPDLVLKGLNYILDFNLTGQRA